jgi:hypothetical protein
VNAVSVWDHSPSADELLEARLASGWVPTPTSTVEGDRILGHAACRVPPSRPAPDSGR